MQVFHSNEIEKVGTGNTAGRKFSKVLHLNFPFQEIFLNWSEKITCHGGQRLPSSYLMNLEVNRKVVSFSSVSLGVISRSMHIYTLLTKTSELLCSDEITLWSWVSGVLVVCLFSFQVNYSAACSGYILCSLVHVARHMTQEETGKWQKSATTKFTWKILSNELDMGSSVMTMKTLRAHVV